MAPFDSVQVANSLMLPDHFRHIFQPFLNITEVILNCPKGRNQVFRFCNFRVLDQDRQITAQEAQVYASKMPYSVRYRQELLLVCCL
jgi:hypothetical protein